MKSTHALLLVLVLGTTAMAGCLGGAKQDVQQTQLQRPREITEETERRFEELTQVIPSNYTFPGQELLEPLVVWVNDTVDSTANAAIESPQDDGGFNFNTFVKAQDFSQYIPPRQPTEIHIVLYWYGNPGQSADLDIFVDLPGTTTHYDPNTDQHFNWNIPVKRMVVNTVGVEAKQHLIGVQVTNGRIAPGQTMPYTLQVSFDYAKDVLTPHHPYAFTVPEGATGVVLRSVKVTGDEHIKAEFAMLSPQDELVSYTLYDDIAIPTESVFIPLRQPGEYVFYAYKMEGGFLSLKADAPVPLRDVRILPLAEERVVDFQNPAAPGVAGHSLTIDTGLLPVDGQQVETPYQEGARSPFNLDRFPLRIEGFFDGSGQSVAGDAEVRILNEKGVVYRAVRSARADMGEQGSLGWSGDHPPFMHADYSLLGKGSYTVSVVVNGYTGTIGHKVLSYDRGAAPSGGA